MPCSLSWRSRLEQVRGVVVVQRGGRLVEDEQLHLLRQRLGDLDELLLADAELADRRDRDLVEADPAEQRRRPRRWPGSSRSGRCGRAARCRGRCSRRSERYGTSASSWWMITMPLCLAVADAPNCTGLAVEHDLAVVGAVPVDAGQDLHQGRLARAVLTADGVDLAAPTLIETSCSALTPGKVLVMDRISRMVLPWAGPSFVVVMGHVPAPAATDRPAWGVVPTREGQEAAWPLATSSAVQ